MKTIVATVYALNPTKGSEDGMGWNFIFQIAKYNKVVAITRKNNRPHIEKYMQENPCETYQNMEFYYYDLPYWLRFWKKGSRGALLYFYLWQFFMPLFIKINKIEFDIAHNLNFHNDWTPSMLWVLGKPMVWGPIGHHPKIPKAYILPVYGMRVYLKDRFLWAVKRTFWKFSPLLKLTQLKANTVLCMNSSVEQRLHLIKHKTSIMPSVASEDVNFKLTDKKGFQVLSVGRLVPLKGFDITIRSFANFYHKLEPREAANVHLTLVGSGPQKQFLINLCQELDIMHAVTFINWIERSKLQNIYRNASVFLFPSHEGAGMVVSEAMSYGLPVLCFDNPGPGEFVNKACGVGVPYRDYQQSILEFTYHLKQLHSDKELLNQLSVNARCHFEQNFSWDVRGKQLLKIYSNILPEEELKEKQYETSLHRQQSATI